MKTIKNITLSYSELQQLVRRCIIDYDDNKIFDNMDNYTAFEKATDINSIIENVLITKDVLQIVKK